MKDTDIRISEKYVLTIEEAASYFSIGRERLRSLVRENQNADWVLWIGSHAHIKRPLFEQVINQTNAL